MFVSKRTEKYQFYIFLGLGYQVVFILIQTNYMLTFIGSDLTFVLMMDSFVLYAYIISPSLDLLVKAVLVLIPKGRIAHQQDI